MALADTLSKIDALKKEIDKLRPINPDQENRIFQKFRLEWNYNSNAIEGNSITLGETQIFLLHGLTAKGKPLKDYLDLRGHNEAIDFLTDFIKRKEKLTEVMIRQLHEILMREFYEIEIDVNGKREKKQMQSGAYKTLPNHVTTDTWQIHEYAKPEDTPHKMRDLVEEFQNKIEAKAAHPVILAALFHHRFTDIHPFPDGNGRLSRLLMNLILMQAGFPPAVIHVKARNDYLFALREADQNKPEGIISLVADEELASLELFLRGAKGEKIESEDDLDKKLALLDIQLKDVEEPLKLSRLVQTEFYKSNIEPLQERLFSKLKKFNSYYDQVMIFPALSVYPDERMQSSRSGGIPQTFDFDSLIPQISSIFKNEFVASLTLRFHWIDFKKAKTRNFNDEFQIEFNFSKPKFILTYHGPPNPLRIETMYQHGFTDEDKNEIIKHICEARLAVIQKNAPLK